VISAKDVELAKKYARSKILLSKTISPFGDITVNNVSLVLIGVQDKQYILGKMVKDIDIIILL